MILYGPKARRPEQRGNIRDLRPLWLLEELGEPYELRLVDSAKGGNETPEFLALNPFRRFPVLQDGGVTLVESSAICLYIADKARRLIPPPGSPERARFHEWLFIATATLEPFVYAILRADLFMPDDAATAAYREIAERSLKLPLAATAAKLGEASHVLDGGFSLADILLSCAVFHVYRKGQLAEHPALCRYVERLYARPAYQRALAKSGGPA